LMKEYGLRSVLVWLGLAAGASALLAVLVQWCRPHASHEAYFRSRPTSYWHKPPPGAHEEDALSEGWPDSCPVLLELLKRDDLAAPLVLGRLGPKAKAALPALREAARRSTWDPFCIQCLEAIQLIERPTAAP